MRNVDVKSTLRRYLGVIAFSIATTLVLSVPSFAVYYNLGMFWKSSTASGPTFTGREISIGSTSCAVISDGAAKCWGWNGSGRIGDGTTVDRSTPVNVTGLGGVISIAVGYGHTCTVLTDGTIKCWGVNASRELGDGTTTTRLAPVSVTGINTAVSVTVGTSLSCAMLSDGTAQCWGWNTYGGLGDGTTTVRTTPVVVTGLTGVQSINSGIYHTCAVVSDGTAKCWGYNASGQLGDGTITNRSSPVAVTGLSGVVTLVGGDSHTCALIAGGSVKCWGLNSNGQLGDGTTTQSNTPVTVTGLTGAISLAAGWSHSCAILSNGTAKCWGNNAQGRLGDGTTTQSLTPVAVTGLTGATSIEAGVGYTCALLANGKEKCWGANASGQLGDGTLTNSSIPITVSGFSSGPFTDKLEDVASIPPASGQQMCVVLSDGAMRCWGLNHNGQLGDGSSTTRSEVPVTVSGVTGAIMSAGGQARNCTLLSDGTVKCWGSNVEGGLGNGTTTNSSTPVSVTGLSGVVSLSSGMGRHTCALLSDRTVKCWGWNPSGQLGNGTYNTGSSVPVSVTGLSGVVSLTAGFEHSCALLSNGTAKCWGDNSNGRLGDGTYASNCIPVTVTGLSGIVSIQAGARHTCAMLSDGTAKCWGYNFEGELGNGTTTDSPTPVSVTGLSNLLSLSGGDFHHCGLLADGTAKCWGMNSPYGALGDGTNTNRSAPVSVTGLSGVGSLSAGGYISCAKLTSGTMKCWGTNGFGQLGDGTLTSSNVPVNVALTKKIVYFSGGLNNNGGGATSLVITKPPSMIVDHVMVAGITVRVSTTTITPPSGWTLLQSQATGNIRQSIYYRVATAADGSAVDYTWSFSASVKASGVIANYANVDPSAPILASDGQATAGSTTITAPSLTTSEDEFEAVYFAGIASDSMITGPSGYTSINTSASTSNGATSRTRTSVFGKRYSTSGSTGTITATDASADDNVGQHVLLKKAP